MPLAISQCQLRLIAESKFKFWGTKIMKMNITKSAFVLAASLFALGGGAE
jgi:hypothetical protein